MIDAILAPFGYEYMLNAMVKNSFLYAAGRFDDSSAANGGSPKMKARLLEPLQPAFMNNALLISSVIAVLCALLSVFLVLISWRYWVMQ